MHVSRQALLATFLLSLFSVTGAFAQAQSTDSARLGATIPRETTTAQEEQQHSRGRQLSTTSSQPTIDDYPKSVATAIAQLMAAWNSNFERVKGPQKNETSGIKQYEVNVVVPGFQCTLNEVKERWHVFCSSNQPADMGEKNHLAIARALAAQLRPMDYSCQSGPVEPATIFVNPVSVHRFVFRRRFADPNVTQYLNRYTEAALYIQPAGSFNISFLVNPPFNPLLKKVVNQPPIDCDYSYSALKSQELRTEAAGASGSTPASQGGGSDRSALLRELSGDWQCDSSSSCQKARILVSGDPGKLDKFSASLDVDFSPNNGWTCNLSRDGHCSWVLSGIIDGLSLDGIAQEPSLHYKKGCDTPYATHRFNGTISDDGRRIVIHTESNIYSPLGSGWIWSKDIVKCTDVRVDHAEAVMMVLRSDRPGQNPISVPQQAVGSNSSPLDATMKLIESNLQELGVVDFKVYVQHKKHKNDTIVHNTFTLSNVVADSANCHIQYHRRGLTDGSGTNFNTDEGFSLRDLQSIEVKPVAKLIESVNRTAGERASVRTEPQVFQLTPQVSGNSVWGLIFGDEKMAYRVANAMRDAAELCGANKPHVY